MKRLLKEDFRDCQLELYLNHYVHAVFIESVENEFHAVLFMDTMYIQDSLINI